MSEAQLLEKAGDLHFLCGWLVQSLDTNPDEPLGETIERLERAGADGARILAIMDGVRKRHDERGGL